MATATIHSITSDQPSLPDLTVLAVPSDQVLLFKAQGRGAQIYPCDPTTHAFGPARPEAVLVTDGGDLIHHFKGPTGPTWKASDDSVVVGTVVRKVPAPAEDAIPWLLLTGKPGGAVGGKLSNVSFIQRVYTKHGNPPPDGCDEGDAGAETPVLYEAEYYFYAPQDCI